MVDRAVVHHFSRAAGGYARLRGAGPLKWMRDRERAAIRELAGIEAGHVVLDAGCGDGANLEWLRECGARAYGIDLTLAMARLSASRGFPVAVQDLEQSGLRPDFDRVLCIGALEFVANPRRALEHLAACLAPAGTLVLLYPRKGHLGTLYALYHRTHGARIHLFSSDEISALLVGAGLAPPTGRRNCLLSSVCTSRLISESSA